MRKLIPLLLLLLLGCAKMSDEKRAKVAREAYSEGITAYQEGDYAEAVLEFTKALKYLEHLSPEEIKSAKLLLGESSYLKKDYVNAVIYLEDFLFYYSDSPEAEKVYYMVVDSYMKVAPNAYRDQTYTFKAIDRAKDFLSKYPNSAYSDEVAKLIEGAQAKLARHEYLIGRFYEDFRYYYSASLRYKNLLASYPGQVSEAEVLYRYIKSLLLVREQAKRQEAKYHKWISLARKELKKAKTEEDRKALQKRIDFFQKEIERWKSLAEESSRLGLKNMEVYRETYGENSYYRELLEYAKQQRAPENP